MNSVQRSFLLPVVFLALLAGAALAQSASPKDTAISASPSPGIIPLSQIQPGMKGTAFTVFAGTEPEEMQVEILGILRNANGPRSSVILARLHGKTVEYTGVVAGMSGSPVYIDGKLAGAIAFRIGEFSKQPIAGITPIEEMLEINEMDSSPAPAAPVLTATAAASRTAAPGLPASAAGYASYLQPIETPLVVTGFSEDTMRRFGPALAQAGIVPVMGVGSVSETPQPGPVVPGSTISAVLVRGDMNMAATCTVTYVDPTRLLACGHPILQFGQVQMPMYKAQVLASLPSPANPFKIVNVTEPVGAFVQDRHTGILGRFGMRAQMIPVTLTVRGTGAPKPFHYEVVNNGKLTPTVMMATVFQALQGVNDSGEDVTYRLEGTIGVAGYPAVRLHNMFAPADAGAPTAGAVAAAIGERFNRIYENPYGRPDIQGVALDFELLHERRWARLESARTDVTEVRPGDQITVEAVLRPYRGDRLLRQMHLRIPTSTPHGVLRILVSDGDTLDRLRRAPLAFGRKLDLASTIAMLNQERANNRLYVSLLEPNPQAIVEDKVMPVLPASVMSVMEGMRGSQDMFVVSESSVDETSTPVDCVVSGAQILTLTVK
jgi:hypothetical protein